MLNVTTFWKGARKIYERALSFFHTPASRALFYLNGAKVGKGHRSSGVSQIYITRRGTLQVGQNFSINSGQKHNVIGRQGRTIFWIEGNVLIGDDVGISNSAIICRNKITIESNVIIGGNCVVYDTDFHPTDPALRLSPTPDLEQANSLPVIIRKNAFIGAHSTILKGVEIGENSVVGACSLVSKSIPANEIWAGNPAKKIGEV